MNNYKKYMRLFPSDSSVYFIAMGLLLPVPKTKLGNQYVLFKADNRSTHG